MSDLVERVRDGEFADSFEAGDILYGPSEARTVYRNGREFSVFPNGEVLPKIAGAQTSGGTAAGHPQPQTSAESPGGPFIRHSQPGRAPEYNVTGVAFSSVVTQPLVARPGYFRKLLVKPVVTTSANAATVVAAADSPANLFTLIQLKDGFGTPLLIGAGFEILKLVPMFGSGHAVFQNPDPFTLPSGNQTNFTNGIVVGSGATGGSVQYIAPLQLEFAKGYGVLAAANASILPTLQMNTGTSASLYSTPPTTQATTMSVQVDTDFYWLPEGVDIEPPGLGTTRQWVVQQANPAVSANSSTRVQFPRLGGFLDTLVIEMRDSTGARNDTYWPSRIQILVDGVPWIDSDILEIFDDMAITWPGLVRPAGVIAISRKTSLSQTSMGLLDTGEVFLSTNPGSLIEVNGSPWANGTNSPALMNVVLGQVVPTGALIQGLPEV